jgi:hypothetical protein
MEAANAIFDVTIGEDDDTCDSTPDTENSEDKTRRSNTFDNGLNYDPTIQPSESMPESIGNGDPEGQCSIEVEPVVQEIPDESEKVYHDVPNPNHVDVYDFHIAVMLLMATTDMSPAQYRVFLETMKFATMEAIRSLPASLATLREHCRRIMPLMKIRVHKLPVALRSIPP